MKDEGLLKYYKLVNTAPKGAKPVEKLVYLNQDAFYANKTIGMQRMYAAKGADYKLDKLVFSYHTPVPEAAKYVILEDGRQYRIGDISLDVEENGCLLSLERLVDYYEVADESTPITTY